MQLGFTCDPQLVFAKVFAFAPKCTLPKVHTQGVNFSQYLNLIFVLVFFFLDYRCQISRFLDILGLRVTKTFFDSRPIDEQHKKLSSVGTSA